MKIKRFIFLIAALILLGCTAIAQKDYPEYKPQEGVSLSSVLYELAVAPDPDVFAKERNIILTKGLVKVYILFDPVSSITEREEMIENYNITIEKKGGNLSRALIPINRLIPLSNESVIQSIKLPDRLVKPDKIKP